MSAKKNTLFIAYDGDCPFCKSYVRMQKLKQLNYEITMVNFRDDPDLVEKLKNKDLNPNNGIYLKIEETEYFAEKAMTALALMSTSNNFLNLIFKWVFKNEVRAKITYPFLRAGRNTWLKIRNKQQL